MKGSSGDCSVSSIPCDWLDHSLPRLLTKYPKVLVVDDSPFFSEILATFFKLEGFTARTAYGGEAALEAFAGERPDIAFVDIVMPDLSGLEVARRILGSQAHQSPLLVALSGWDEEDVRAEAAAAGFHHFMIKPVDPGSLRGFLAGLLE